MKKLNQDAHEEYCRGLGESNVVALECLTPMQPDEALTTICSRRGPQNLEYHETHEVLMASGATRYAVIFIRKPQRDAA
ncbi:hypothetical protein LZK73_18450 [Neorhizobium galegae]|nr:hypothetical protein LZK73_18450 [Neorhizobium galegae]